MTDVSTRTPCREYRGARTSLGYGAVKRHRRMIGVHRLVVERVGEDQFGTAWDPSLVVMHLCDNRACFRFDHLRLGTQADNVNDCRDKERNAVFYGEAHGQAKLTESDVREMRRRREAGETYYSIAADFPVTRHTVSMVCRRRLWGWLP